MAISTKGSEAFKAQLEEYLRGKWAEQNQTHYTEASIGPARSALSTARNPLTDLSWKPDPKESFKHTRPADRFKGATVDFMIYDEVERIHMGDTIDTPERSTAMEEKKLRAADLDFSHFDPDNEAHQMDFRGGMITLKRADGSFRKTTIGPLTLTPIAAYDGKKQGVIVIFKPAFAMEHKGAAVKHCEIPYSELSNHFVAAAVRWFQDTATRPGLKRKEELYAPEITGVLTDFGIF